MIENRTSPVNALPTFDYDDLIGWGPCWKEDKADRRADRRMGRRTQTTDNYADRIAARGGICMHRRWTSLVGVAIGTLGLVLMVAGEGTVKSGGDFGQGAITAALGTLMIAVPVLIHNRAQKRAAASVASTDSGKQEKMSNTVYHTGKELSRNDGELY